GHTQAAAGVGGIIKMVMAIRHGILPRTLHADEPSPHIDWTSGAVSLLTEQTPWPQTGEPRRAGISSFGVSGTNAHVIIEQAPDPDTDPSTTATEPLITTALVPWVLSGRTDTALRAQAGRLREFLTSHAEEQVGLGEVGWSLATGRTHFDHRAVILGASHQDMMAGLAALADGQDTPSVIRGTRSSQDGRAVFVFPGQGSQWAGMALDLLDTTPIFRQHIEACERALAPHTDWRLTDVLRGLPGAPSMDRVDVVQPVLFAVMVSLARLWQAHGIEPSAVIGHSQGEIAAAHIAGALTLDEAARIAALRSQAITRIAGKGGMGHVALPQDQVTERLTAWPGLSVAAVNGPTSTVISGDTTALQEFITACETDGVRARTIPVDYASHSTHVEELRNELTTLLADITPQASTIPFYSTVTGTLLDTRQLTTEYWYTNLRETVRFHPTLTALLHDGHTLYIETSPHPVLTTPTQDTIDTTTTTTTDTGGAVVGTLRRDEPGPTRFLTSLAQAHTHGTTPTWTTLNLTTRHIALPTYPFQHQHYWPETAAGTLGDVSSAGLGAVGHPLLGAAVGLAEADGMLFTGQLSLRAQPWLADHAVLDSVLLPGTAFVELAIRAGDEVGCGRVEELTLEAPLVLSRESEVQLQLSLGEADAAGRRALAVYSRPEGGTSAAQQPWVRNASGTLLPDDGRDPAPADLRSWPPAGATPVPVEGVYPELAARGYAYGPAFRGLRAAWRLGEEIFAEVALAEDDHAAAARFGLHPALLDAALHALGLVEGAGRGGVGLPFSWSGVSLHATGATALRVRLSPAGEDTVSLTVADPGGQPVASVDSLVLRPVSAAQLDGARAANDRSLLQLDWSVLSTGAAPSVAPGSWAVVGSDAPGLAGSLAAAAVPVAGYGSLEALGAAVASGVPAPTAVFVSWAPEAGAGADGESAGESALREIAAVHSVTRRALADVQYWLSGAGVEALASSRLVVVTRGAVSVAEAVGGPAVPVDLAQAPLWGLLRSAQSENPDRFVLLDVDGEEASWRSLPAALPAALAAEHAQLVIREGVARVPRLAWSSQVGRALAAPAGASPWRLEVDGPGTLENLALVPCPSVDEPLAEGQVRISVRASGLNFRDVLIALGMYPDATALMGSEAAGVVLEVGPGVTRLAPGDQVVGLLAGGFGTVAVTDHRMVVPMPAGWSYTEAAAVPVVFLTAYFGLRDLGGLRAGESVLVHAAAGGVGMAAVQLARYWGAEVFGTASSGKWDTLRAMGLDDDHIASSRDLGFEEAFGAVTRGRGVDVVLDSLAREFVDASLRLLAPGGRFIEMGKTDIRVPGEVAAVHPGVSYRAFDLVEAGPERIGEMLTEVFGLFEQGVLQPLPITVWDVRRAPEAFRHLSQARHVGKMVLTVPAPVNPDGTVLITGGTGVLGGLVARHLVTDHGARHLVLVSRSGPDAAGATELHAELTALGATVTIAACDTADPEALGRLLDAVPDRHPLSTVVHAAGALQDAVLTRQTPEHLARALTPKVDTAVHLHHLTRHLPLDHFILFSSASGILGATGQANYAAANAYLDALAHHRHAQGLPATSIAWGLWAESSAMTGHLNDTDIHRMTRAGMAPLATDEGLALLDAALATPHPLSVALRLADGGPRSDEASVPSLLRGLVRAPARRAAGGAAAGSDGPSLGQRLAGLPEAEQERVVLREVLGHIAAVLGHSSADGVDGQRSFKEFGFDSLTAVELRNRLNRVSGLRLPATLVFDHPTPGALARRLRTEIAPETAGFGAASAGLLEEIGRLEAVLASCSPEELAAIAPDAEARSAVTGRLKSLVSLWTEAAAAPEGAAQPVSARLQSASDDELFAFIDEFGTS
ncbi:SDR family NAD(P)-dependent oxidoreductase, partial [Kitasatospora aburaviensis]